MRLEYIYILYKTTPKIIPYKDGTIDDLLQFEKHYQVRLPRNKIILNIQLKPLVSYNGNPTMFTIQDLPSHVMFILFGYTLRKVRMVASLSDI